MSCGVDPLLYYFIYLPTLIAPEENAEISLKERFVIFVPIAFLKIKGNCVTDEDREREKEKEYYFIGNQSLIYFAKEFIMLRQRVEEEEEDDGMEMKWNVNFCMCLSKDMELVKE